MKRVGENMFAVLEEYADIMAQEQKEINVFLR